MNYIENKAIPYYYLYDKLGSELFDEITSVEEYYPFKTEKQILIDQVEKIFHNRIMESDKINLIEFGAGFSVKTKIIIERLSTLYKEVVFIPIDVSESACLLSKEKFSYLDNVKVIPYVCSNDEFLDKLFTFDSPVIYLFLGSSIGNMIQSQQLEFLNRLNKVINFQDEIIIGFDCEPSETKDKSVILAAYNDKKGVTAKFILNILKHFQQLYELNINNDDFEYYSLFNEEYSRVEMYLNCIKDTIVSDKNDNKITIKQGEKIFVEYSHKFSKAKVENICSKSNLMLVNIYTDQKNYFMLCSIKKDIECVFELTNRIFEKYIGYENLDLKPIEVRNKFIFYLGHISTFYDIKTFNLPENEIFYQLFERGRDPILSSLECHRHSKIDVEYPDYKEIIEYNNKIRNKTKDFILKNGFTYNLMMSIEHELMHQETLYYATRFIKRDIEISNLPENYTPPEKKILKIPSRKILQGKKYQFGWDNEFPIHEVEVKSFNVDNLPITWADFREFLENTKTDEVLFLNNYDLNTHKIRINESNWIDYEKGKNLPAWVNLEVALKYVDFCNKKGVKCRLMTEDEFDSLSSVLDSFLKGNINFKNLNSMPVGFYNDFTEDGVGELYGNGWELTSTKFRPFEGFKQMKLYKEYSNDFFTDYHYVVKGASPYTPSTICRRSFRNWFQFNYQFHTCKFRLVYTEEN